MNKRKFLFTGIFVYVLSLFAISCSNTAVSPTNYSRIQFINAIPGSLSLDCVINYTKANSTTLAFPNSTGYISTTPGNKFIGIRPTSTPAVNFLDSVNVVVERDSSYSLFFTGQTRAYKNIFIKDNLTAPAIGRAKVRFVNASASTASLDITINSVYGFNSITYGSVGKFVEVPAGVYEFKAYSTGTTASTLTTLSNQTLADGKIYTLYAQGTTGNTTSAFGLSLINNLLPATK